MQKRDRFLESQETTGRARRDIATSACDGRRQPVTPMHGRPHMGDMSWLAEEGEGWEFPTRGPVVVALWCCVAVQPARRVTARDAHTARHFCPGMLALRRCHKRCMLGVGSLDFGGFPGARAQAGARVSPSAIMGRLSASRQTIEASVCGRGNRVVCSLRAGMPR